MTRGQARRAASQLKETTIKSLTAQLQNASFLIDWQTQQLQRCWLQEGGSDTEAREQEVSNRMAAIRPVFEQLVGAGQSGQAARIPPELRLRRNVAAHARLGTGLQEAMRACGDVQCMQ